MYKLSLGLILVATTGCSANQMHLEQRTELASRTSSLALYDDGTAGLGSMNEQTCLFDGRGGFIIADYDLPTADERVEDVRGTVAIARTVEGIHVIDENGWDKKNDIALAGVQHAKMSETGVVSLLSDEAGCRVDWRNDDDSVTTAELSADVCATADGFVVDRTSGQAFVAFGTDVVTATSDGVVESFGIAGDLLAIDEVSGNISISTRGSARITTVNTSGEVQWTETVTGTVYDLSDFGARGATAVVVDDGDVTLEAFDASTGEQVADYGLPGVAELVVSADASTIGLVTEDVVYFYDVFEGSAPVVFNEVNTEPPQMFAD